MTSGCLELLGIGGLAVCLLLATLALVL